MIENVKIGVVGCGALGSFYGAKLCRDGREVHFLLRSDYEVVRREGVRIRSVEGDFQVNPKCARTPEEIGVCDLILIGLKSTANDQFAALLTPLVGPATTLMTLQNGLGNERQLASLFGVGRILGGLCFVCLNRVEPGVVQHLAHGAIVMGEYAGLPGARTQDIASIFQHAGISCRVTEDLERAHWEKLIWNIPFNGLGVASAAGHEALAGSPSSLRRLRPTGACLPTDRLLADAQWETLVRELMLEVIAAANALGFRVPESAAETQISRTRTMGTYKASTLIDFERGMPLELESMFLEPLREAKRAGIATPRLAALCGVLKRLNPGARRQ